MATSTHLAPQDIPTIIDLSGFGPAGIQVNVVKLGHLARGNLVKRAQLGLHATSIDYVKAIQPLRIETMGRGTKAIIELRGGLPNMIENGAGPWDLRTTILKAGTRKLKVSKDGFLYLSIPFRHFLPGSSGKSGGMPMGGADTKEGQHPLSRAHRGDLTAEEARIRGRAVAEAAKRLAATRSGPGAGPRYGGRLGAGVGGSGLLRPRHVTDIYAGMIRESKTYEKKTENQFMTFRTISMNPKSKRSDTAGPGGAAAVSWTHPGFTARLFVQRTHFYVMTLLAAGQPI